MILSLTPLRFTRSDKRRWHQRRVFLRQITVGGYGTSEPERRLFILYARLWARRSETRGRWLFAEHRPAKENSND